jgi:cell division transport system permease protein
LEFVKIVDKLLKLRTGMEKLIFWLFILFLGGGILLAVNTFRLVIFSRKDEVYISRLVGADSSFIAGPFLIEGLLLGFIAALLAIIVFVLVLREISILPGGEVFLHLWNEVFSEEILIAGAVGVLGAWISIKNYLVGRIFE